MEDRQSPHQNPESWTPHPTPHTPHPDLGAEVVAGLTICARASPSTWRRMRKLRGAALAAMAAAGWRRMGSRVHARTDGRGSPRGAGCSRTPRARPPEYAAGRGGAGGPRGLSPERTGEGGRVLSPAPPARSSCQRPPSVLAPDFPEAPALKSEKRPQRRTETMVPFL